MVVQSIAPFALLPNVVFSMYFYHWQSVFPPTSAKCHELVMTVSEDVSLRSKDVDVDFRMSKSHNTKESFNISPKLTGFEEVSWSLRFAGLIG